MKHTYPLRLFGLAACLLLLGAALAPAAQPTSFGLETGFGDRGKLLFTQSPSWQPGTAAVADRAGRILAAIPERGYGRQDLIRLLPDGSIDRSFAATSKPAVEAIAVDSRNRVLVSVGHEQTLRLARYLPSGSLDRGFGESGTASIAIPGIFGHVEGTQRTVLFTDDRDRVIVARLNTARTGGRHGTGFVVARLTASGAVDTSFGSDGFFTAMVRHPTPFNLADLLFDQRSEAVTLLSASYTELRSEGAPRLKRFELVRLLPGGGPDPGFGDGGTVRVAVGRLGSAAGAMARDSRGRIVVGGSNGRGLGLARLLPDGSLDPAFGNRGKLLIPLGADAPSSRLGDVAIGDHNRILIAASADGRGLPRPGLMALRLRADGAIDRSFGRSGRCAVAFPKWNMTSAMILPLPAGASIVGRASRPKPGSYPPTAPRLRALVLASCRSELPSGARPASAAVAAGGLDSTFGNRGRVLTALPPLSGGWSARRPQIAVGSDGSSMIATASELASYLPDGQLDTAFSGDGVVPIEPPLPGEFDLAGLEVDSAGRILIAGTWVGSPPEAQAPPCSSDCAAPIERSLAAVFRYLPDGSPDPEFGRDGVLLTDFGLPSPIDALTGAAVGPSEVEVTGLLLDREGRVLVSGAFVESVGACRVSGPLRFTDGYLARLTPGGVLDGSFATGGMRMLPRFKDATLMGGLSAGGVQLLGPVDNGCDPGPLAIGRLSAGGNPLPDFGRRGIRQLPGVEGFVDWTWAPHGQMLFLSSTRGSGTAILPSSIRRNSRASLNRLTADGRLDRSFGDDGTLTVVLPAIGSQLNAIATDRRGDVYLAGRELHGYGHPNRSYNTFLLGRLIPSGSLDPHFGDGGWLSTRFGPGSSSAASDMGLLPGGRVLLAGSATSPSLGNTQGVALARYRFRPGGQPGRAGATS